MEEGEVDADCGFDVVVLLSNGSSSVPATWRCELSKSMVPADVQVSTRFSVKSIPQGWIWCVCERRFVRMPR